MDTKKYNQTADRAPASTYKSIGAPYTGRAPGTSPSSNQEGSRSTITSSAAAFPGQLSRRPSEALSQYSTSSNISSMFSTYSRSSLSKMPSAATQGTEYHLQFLQSQNLPSTECVAQKDREHKIARGTAALGAARGFQRALAGIMPARKAPIPTAASGSTKPISFPSDQAPTQPNISNYYPSPVATRTAQDFSSAKPSYHEDWPLAHNPSLSVAAQSAAKIAAPATAVPKAPGNNCCRRGDGTFSYRQITSASRGTPLRPPFPQRSSSFDLSSGDQSEMGPWPTPAAAAAAAGTACGSSGTAGTSTSKLDSSSTGADSGKVPSAVSLVSAPYSNYVTDSRSSLDKQKLTSGSGTSFKQVTSSSSSTSGGYMRGSVKMYSTNSSYGDVSKPSHIREAQNSYTKKALAVIRQNGYEKMACSGTRSAPTIFKKGQGATASKDLSKHVGK